MPTRIKAYSVGLPSLWQTRPPKKIIWLVVVEETPTATRLVTSILPHATSRTNLDRNRNGSSRGAKFCRSSHSNKRLLSSSCWRWGNESPQSWGKWDVDEGFKRTTLPQDTATWRCSLRKCSSCFPQNKRKRRQRKWMTSFRMLMKEIGEGFEIELKKLLGHLKNSFWTYYKTRMDFKICGSDDRLQFVEVKLPHISKFYFRFPKVEQLT